jgi:uncharacterized protein (TIGR03437 family)
MSYRRYFSALLLFAVAASRARAQCYEFSGSGATLQIDITSFVMQNGPNFSGGGAYMTNDRFQSNNTFTVGGATTTSHSTTNTPDCVNCKVGSVMFNFGSVSASSAGVTAFTMTVPANNTVGSMDAWFVVLGGVGNVIPTGLLPTPQAFPAISQWVLPANENNIQVATASGFTNYPITSIGPCSGSSTGGPSTSTSVTVNSNQGPWEQSLNPNFNYGAGDNAAPAVVSASSGIPFTPGGTITVTYVSGQVNVYPEGGFPATNANGYPGDATGTQVIAGGCSSYPSFFMSASSYPVYASELVGTFANNGVIVGTPFPTGDGPATFVIPSSANQLLLGVDDDCFFDNTGSWSVSASYAPLVVSNVLNGASSQTGIVPGSFAAVYGTNLAPVTDNWNNFISDGKLPTTVDGVSVTVGGMNAYLSFVSPGQINFIVPPIPAGPQQVVVKNSIGTGTAFAATAASYDPAFFPWQDNQIVATHLDYTLAAKNGTFGGATVPAKPGETIVLWGTGFGPTNPGAPAGEETPSNATYSTSAAVTVTLDNLPVTVFGAALAPGFAGLYQVAIQVPASIGDGDWPIVAAVNKVSSPSGMVLTVQQ